MGAWRLRFSRTMRGLIPIMLFLLLPMSVTAAAAAANRHSTALCVAALAGFLGALGVLCRYVVIADTAGARLERDPGWVTDGVWADFERDFRAYAERNAETTQRPEE